MQAEDQGGGPAPAAGPAAVCNLTESALGSLTPDQAMALAAALVGQFAQQEAELAEQRAQAVAEYMAMEEDEDDNVAAALTSLPTPRAIWVKSRSSE